MFESVYRMDSEFTATFFDESSKAWMMNKKRKGESYIYTYFQEVPVIQKEDSKGGQKEGLRRSPRLRNRSSKPSN